MRILSLSYDPHQTYLIAYQIAQIKPEEGEENPDIEYMGAADLEEFERELESKGTSPGIVIIDSLWLSAFAGPRADSICAKIADQACPVIMINNMPEIREGNTAFSAKCPDNPVLFVETRSVLNGTFSGILLEVADLVGAGAATQNFLSALQQYIDSNRCFQDHDLNFQLGLMSN